MTEHLKELVDHIDVEIKFDEFTTIDHLAEWADEDEDIRADLGRIATGRRSYRVSMRTLKKGLRFFLEAQGGFRLFSVGDVILITSSNKNIKRIF